MTGVAPGWYKDPADPTTQRYWDGEGWIGDRLPADAQPPAGPPPAAAPATTPTSPPATPTSPPATPTSPTSPPAAPPTAPPVGPSGPPGTAPPGTAPPVPFGPPGPQQPPWPYQPTSPQLPAGPYQATGSYPPPGPPGWAYPLVPAPRPHGLALATPGARLVARLVDIAVVTGLALLANGWFLYQLVRELGPLYEQATRGVAINDEAAGRVNTLILLISIVSAAVWLAYEVPAIANTGQTIGKRLLGLKVMRLEAPDRIGYGRALGRWTTLGLPTLLWPCCGLGLVMQVVDCLFVATDRPLHQALHDKRARTVVVHIGQETPRMPDGGSS